MTNICDQDVEYIENYKRPEDWFAARNICDDKGFANFVEISSSQINVGLRWSVLRIFWVYCFYIVQLQVCLYLHVSVCIIIVHCLQDELFSESSIIEEEAVTSSAPAGMTGGQRPKSVPVQLSRRPDVSSPVNHHNHSIYLAKQK